jgi:gamma-glutamyltranspeptidase/glutathione hydrolase
MGARGMVATGHPLASDAALDVLKAGGNAFDAALCASGVLSVVKSYHCGLGGDLFGIFYSVDQGKLLVLNGSGRAPKKICRELFSQGIPHRGVLAASTPGTIDRQAGKSDSRRATRAGYSLRGQRLSGLSAPG